MSEKKQTIIRGKLLWEKPPNSEHRDSEAVLYLEGSVKWHSHMQKVKMTLAELLEDFIGKRVSITVRLLKQEGE